MYVYQSIIVSVRISGSRRSEGLGLSAEERVPRSMSMSMSMIMFVYMRCSSELGCAGNVTPLRAEDMVVRIFSVEKGMLQVVGVGGMRV